MERKSATDRPSRVTDSRRQAGFSRALAMSPPVTMGLIHFLAIGADQAPVNSFIKNLRSPDATAATRVKNFAGRARRVSADGRGPQPVSGLDQEYRWATQEAVVKKIWSSRTAR